MRARTADPRLKSPLLDQLSYRGGRILRGLPRVQPPNRRNHQPRFGIVSATSIKIGCSGTQDFFPPLPSM